MKSTAILTALALSSSVRAVTYELIKSPHPNADELDAYRRITNIMDDAVRRWADHPLADRHCKVHYTPHVRTAEANPNGDVNFGSDRQYMTTRTALHEIAHVHGMGYARFQQNCRRGEWPLADMVMSKYEGEGKVVQCSGIHFYPYGLNYETEWSETTAARHVEIVDAMIRDGMMEPPRKGVASVNN